MSDPTIFSDSSLPEENNDFWGIPDTPEDDLITALYNGYRNIHVEIEEPDTYVCSSCQRDLPRDKFPKKKVQTYQCKECCANYQREYRQTEHGKKVRAATEMRRRAKKKSLPADFTVDDWNYALTYFKHCCAVCERPTSEKLTLSRDHWIPLSKDGATNPENIIPLCHGFDGCNSSKKNHDPDEWLGRTFDNSAEIKERIQRYFQHIKERNDQ